MTEFVIAFREWFKRHGYHYDRSPHVVKNVERGPQLAPITLKEAILEFLEESLAPEL